jgi:hypothetical protein
MKTAPQQLLLVMIAALLLAVAWWRPQRAPQPGSAAALAPGASVRASPGAGASASEHWNALPGAAGDARPPRRQVEVIRDWRARAERGDDAAACRYAREALFCAALIHHTAPWRRARFAAQAVTRGAFGEIADCRGVEDADIAAQFDLLLAAAERGHVPSQALFAAGGGFASFEGVRFPERLLRFRERAGVLAWRAFDAGDSDAAVLLWRVYNRVGSDQLHLAGALAPDPVRAHALDLLLADLVPGVIAGSAEEAGLDPAAAAAAQALHARWRALSFADARAPRFGLEIERMFDWERREVDLCAEAPPPR